MLHNFSYYLRLHGILIIGLLLIRSLNVRGNNVQDNFDVKFYHLDLQISDTSTFIKGNTTILVEIIEESDSIILDLGNQLTVNEVQINGKVSFFRHFNEEISFESSAFRQGEQVSIVVFYEGDADDENYNGALFNTSYEPYGTFTYSLTEPYSTKCWFPCKEVLTDKADSVYVYITVPKSLKAGSNGLLKQIVPIDDGRVQYQWESLYPTAFYLISVAVGDYQDYTFYSYIPGAGANIPVVNYIYKGEEVLLNSRQDIDTTGYLLQIFSEIFKPYPFHEEKYGHCIVPLGGGMEHQTMSTMGNFNFDLVAHELAHQWFGNWVTCSSWNDIWINEGFASYAEYLAHEVSGNIDGARAWMESAQYAALNSIVGSIYVPDDELGDYHRLFNYNSTYKKGASIIHMLRYELADDELFFNVLKTFLDDYAFSTASAQDFLSVLNKLSGKDFTFFFEQWYYGSGYPVYNIEWYKTSDTLYIKAVQTSSDNDDELFEHRVHIKYTTTNYDSIIETRVNSGETFIKCNVKEPVLDISFDPDNYLLKKVNSVQRVDSLMSYIVPDVLLYPNPTKGLVKLYVKDVFEPVDVCLYSQLGKKIKLIENIIPAGYEISLSDVDKGVYLLSIEVGAKRSMVKLIKS